MFRRDLLNLRRWQLVNLYTELNVRALILFRVQMVFLYFRKLRKYVCMYVCMRIWGKELPGRLYVKMFY